jgi:hypothetical protein
MKFTVFGDREVEIDNAYAECYQEIYDEPLTDHVMQYFAITGGCTADMTDQELTDGVERSIFIELDAMMDMPRLIAKAKADGVIDDEKERRTA